MRSLFWIPWSYEENLPSSLFHLLLKFSIWLHIFGWRALILVLSRLISGDWFHVSSSWNEISKASDTFSKELPFHSQRVDAFFVIMLLLQVNRISFIKILRGSVSASRYLSFIASIKMCHHLKHSLFNKIRLKHDLNSRNLLRCTC